MNTFPDKKLEVPYYGNYFNIEEWIPNETRTRLEAEGSPSEEEIKAASEEAMTVFRQNRAHVQEALKSNPLIDRIQPSMFNVRGFQFIYLFLKGFVEEYFLDHPEDVETVEKWRGFCRDFAYLRYNRDRSISDRVEQFFNAISEKLALYRMGHEESSAEMITIFKKLCSDPDLLDVNLGLLLKGEAINDKLWRCTTNVISAQQAYFLLVREMTINSPWVIDYCQQKLASHLKGVLSKVAYTESGGQTFTQLITRGFERLSAQMNAFGRIQSDSIEGILQKMPQIKKIVKELELLFSDKDIFADFQPIVNDMKKNPGDFSRHSELVEALQEFSDCHIVLDTYLSGFWNALKGLTNILEDWSTHTKSTSPSFRKFPKKYSTFLKSIPRVITTGQHFFRTIPGNSSPSSSSSTNQYDFDAALTFITGSSKPKIKAGGSSHPQKKKNVRSKARVTKQQGVKQTTPEPSCSSDGIAQAASQAQPSVSVASSSYAVISREDRIRSTLLELITTQSSQPTSFLKPSLRQAELAFNSLLAAYQKVLQTPLEAFRSYHYYLVISKMYYLIEQLLRYKKIERDPTSGDFNHHILQRLMNLGIQDHPAVSIAIRLRSANLWVAYTDTQMTSRQLINLSRHWKVVTPPVLSHLHQISQNHPTELCSLLKSELKSFYEEMLALIELIIPAIRIETPSVSMEPKRAVLNLTETFNPATIKRLRRHLNPLISSTENGDFGAVDQLREGKRSLGFLKHTLQRLSSPELTLEEFSPLLRDAIYLTNQVCESLLQVLVAKKQGINTHEHDLENLLRTAWNNCPKRILDFFRKKFQGINTDSRYPFDLGRIRSSLHQRILEAEFLRERMELEEGFEMQGQTSSTDLNYISLPKTAFRANIIWSKTSTVLSHALNLVFQQILPSRA